jgi:hypothetical protein
VPLTARLTGVVPKLASSIQSLEAPSSSRRVFLLLDCSSEITTCRAVRRRQVLVK